MKEVFGGWYTDWKFIYKLLLQEKTMFWMWHNDMVDISNELDASKGLLYGACIGLRVPIQRLKDSLGIKEEIGGEI